MYVVIACAVVIGNLATTLGGEDPRVSLIGVTVLAMGAIALWGNPGRGK